MRRVPPFRLTAIAVLLMTALVTPHVQPVGAAVPPARPVAAPLAGAPATVPEVAPVAPLGVRLRPDVLVTAADPLDAATVARLATLVVVSSHAVPVRVASLRVGGRDLVAWGVDPSRSAHTPRPGRPMPTAFGNRWPTATSPLHTPPPRRSNLLSAARSRPPAEVHR